MKKSSHLSGLHVGLILTLISLAVFYIAIPFFELVELKAYDLHFAARGESVVGPEVVIVTVDVEVAPAISEIV